jgi:hypothetical protein
MLKLGLMIIMRLNTCIGLIFHISVRKPDKKKREGLEFNQLNQSDIRYAKLV